MFLLCAVLLLATSALAGYAAFHFFELATTVLHEIQAILCAGIAVVAFSGWTLSLGLSQLLARRPVAPASPVSQGEEVGVCR